MFINKLQLKNFKRFTDLTVDLAPQPPKGGANQQGENPPKLVLLIGVNGSGKSCIFDAFEAANGIISNEKLIQAFEDLKTEKKKGYLSGLGLPDNDYCSKKKDVKDKNGYEVIIHLDKNKHFNFNSHFKSISKANILVRQASLETNLQVGNHFYGRTAFRNIIDLETKFNADEYGEKDVQKVIEKNLDKPSRLIDLDKRWDGDILYCFKEEIDRQELTIELNKSLNSIFAKNPIGHFQIESIKSEIGRSIKLSLEVLIRKGTSIFPYEYLSAGEKQLFTILLNLHLRKKYLENTIIYLDEIDLHLNTSIQSDLLKEITENLIPDNSQVWVASHSLGFIDYARQKTYKYDEITETEVEIKKVILDFDNLNFDEVQVLKPEKRDNLKVYDIAVPQETLAVLFQDKQKIYCENKNDKYYNLLALQNKIFLPETDKNAVFLRLQNNKENDAFGIIDRDYLSDREREKLMQKFENIKVLEYYCFENYLYHPDNINELKISGFDKQEYIKKLIEIKNRENDNIKANLSNSRNSYIFFKKNEEFKLKDENLDCIFKLLNSDELEDFYKVFSMKNKQDLANINKHKSELVRTNWFKTKINEVLQ